MEEAKQPAEMSREEVPQVRKPVKEDAFACVGLCLSQMPENGIKRMVQEWYDEEKEFREGKLDTVFTVGSKKVDARKGLPLRLAQFSRMKKEFGVDLEDVMKVSTEQLNALAHVIFQKVDPSVTTEDIAELGLYDFRRFQKVVGRFGNQEPDRPTSGPSHP
jgi:hypothetical protein